MGADLARRDLEHLYANLDRMDGIVEKTLDAVTSALLEWRSIDLEEQLYLVEMLMEMIEEQATFFIAKYQPLGPELLEAKAIIRASYDLYRISRYCREIARLIDAVGPGRRVEMPGEIREAITVARGMVGEAYKAFRERDEELKRRVKEKDDLIDGIYTGMLARLGGESSFSTRDVVALLVARHLERIADHAVYIASLPRA